MAIVTEAFGRLAGVLYEGCAPDSMCEIIDKAIDRIADLESQLAASKKRENELKTTVDCLSHGIMPLTVFFSEGSGREYGLPGDNVGPLAVSVITQLKGRNEALEAQMSQHHIDYRAAMERNAVLEDELLDTGKELLAKAGEVIIIEQKIAGLEAKLGQVKDWVGRNPCHRKVDGGLGVYCEYGCDGCEIDSILSNTRKPLAVVNMAMCLFCHSNHITADCSGVFHCDNCGAVPVNDCTVVVFKEVQDD